MTRVSVIIPVADDSRNNFLNSILESLEKQSLTDFEVILVIGDNRQGRAINKGVSEAKGRWIVTMDDDTQIFDDGLLEKLVTAMEENPSIGLGGAACHIPQDCSPFLRKAMKEIPRRYFPIQEKNIESDFVQHPCLIIEREFFLSIGGEDEELIRGLDPVLRKKVRDAGKSVSIIAQTSVAHLLPDNFKKIFNMYRRNGRGSVFAQKFYPTRVFELTDGYDQGSFTEERTVYYRILRRLYTMLRSLVRAHWIRQATDIAYVIGWLEGWLLGEFPEAKCPVHYSEDEVEQRKTYRLKKIRTERLKNSPEEQIARLHIKGNPEFVLGDEDHPALEFFRDKVGVFRNYAGDGFLYETNEHGEVLGFLMLVLHPKTFKMTLIKKGYGLRYFISLLIGRYRGSAEGWKKWLRLPLAFIQKPLNSPGSGGAKIVAFVVREDLRSQGIGTKLLKRTESLALSFGRHHLEVSVNKNNEGARRLYERYGFEVTGEILESTGDSYYLERSVGVP